MVLIEISVILADEQSLDGNMFKLLYPYHLHKQLLNTRQGDFDLFYSDFKGMVQVLNSVVFACLHIVYPTPAFLIL